MCVLVRISGGNDRTTSENDLRNGRLDSAVELASIVGEEGRAVVVAVVDVVVVVVDDEEEEGSCCGDDDAAAAAVDVVDVEAEDVDDVSVRGLCCVGASIAGARVIESLSVRVVLVESDGAVVVVVVVGDELDTEAAAGANDVEDVEEVDEGCLVGGGLNGTPSNWGHRMALLAA